MLVLTNALRVLHQSLGASVPTDYWFLVFYLLGQSWNLPGILALHVVSRDTSKWLEKRKIVQAHSGIDATCVWRLQYVWSSLVVKEDHALRLVFILKKTWAKWLFLRQLGRFSLYLQVSV